MTSKIGATSMTQVYGVKLPVNKVYRILLDFFSTQHDIKIRHSVEPSSIEVEIGSWTSLRHNSPGTVKISLFPKSKESQIGFNFSFGTWFFVWAAIDAFIFLILLLLRAVALLVGQLVITLFVFTLTMPDNVDKTKKSFVNRVINLLKEKKCIVEKAEVEKPS